MTSRGNHQNLSAVSASILQWGSNYTHLAQSNIVTGYVPVVQSNGTLQLAPSSALSTPWADVLADGNTSGANNPIISSPQSLIFAANSVGIGVNNVAKSPSNGDILIGSGTRSGGSTQPIIVIGSGTGNALNTATAPTIVIGSGTATLSGGGQIVIGSGTVSTTSGVGIGSSISVGSGVGIGSSANVTGSGVGIGPAVVCGSSNSVSIGINANVASTCAQGTAVGNGATAIEDLDCVYGSLCTTVGTGGSGRRIVYGSECTAGLAGIAYSCAFGSACISTGQASTAIGRLASALGQDSVAISTSSSSYNVNDISIGSAASCTNVGGQHSRISVGASSSVANLYGIAIGSQANVSSTGQGAYGRLASSTHANSYVFGTSATSRQANEIVLGNNATGGNVSVYGDVGTGGAIESSGYLISFRRVEASISPSATQNIASGSGATLINLTLVNYAADYGSPAITSVASRLQTRANRTMSGYFSVQFSFLGPPAANGYVNIRVMRGVNGVPNILSPVTYFILAGATDHSVTIPFEDLNLVVPAPNVEYYCDIDNAGVFGQTLQIQTGTHFVGSFVN